MRQSTRVGLLIGGLLLVALVVVLVPFILHWTAGDKSQASLVPPPADPSVPSDPSDPSDPSVPSDPAPCDNSDDAACAAALTDALLLKYRPVVYLNTAEKFFPVSIEDFLANSRLVRSNNKAVLKDYGEITTQNIGSFNDVYGGAGGGPAEDLMVEIRDSAHPGTARDRLHEVPVYVAAYDDPSTNSLVAQYVFLYAYNGAQHVAGQDFGAHKGDVEHVSVFIDKTTHEITQIYFAAHNTGNGRLVTRDSGRLQFEGAQPVVYSARWSHASYEKKGKFPQGRAHTGSVIDKVSTYDDMTDDTGAKWRPDTVVVIDDTTGWNTFKGNLGGGADRGPRAPLQQKGWYGKGL